MGKGEYWEVKPKHTISPDHRAKISAALKRYAARPDSHLHGLHKSGVEHPNWKGGVAPKVYQRVGYAAHGDTCARCGEPAKLIHHRDENHGNCDPSNLEPLCRQCHMQHHHGKRVWWTCPACGTLIELIPSLATKRRFCTRACKQAHRGEAGRYV